MRVHRNKCGYRGKTFEHYHGRRCVCFLGAPAPITPDPEIDWTRNINVYWTSVRDGAVYGGNGTSAPEKPGLADFARREKHFRLWLANNATRARELGRKAYEKEGLVDPLGPGGFPLVSVARGGIRYPTPADYARAQGQARRAEIAAHFTVHADGEVTQNVALEKARCKIAGPYLPVGDIDWNCRTHGVDCVDAADGAIVCPTSGMDKAGAVHMLGADAIIRKHSAEVMRAVPPGLPSGSYIVDGGDLHLQGNIDPETGVREDVLDATHANPGRKDAMLVASGGFCMPTEAAYSLGLTPVKAKANPDDYVWRKSVGNEFGSWGKVHVAVASGHNLETALCTVGRGPDERLTLGRRDEESVEHEGRCKRCLHYIGATGGALPPDWDRTVNAVAIKKEHEMDTKARAEALRNEADKLLERAAELENRPSEPEVDDEGNAVVWIRATFRGNDERSYDYAAIRTTEGLWYSTGGERSGSAASWDRLIGYFFDNCAKVEVWQATEFTGIGAK